MARVTAAIEETSLATGTGSEEWLRSNPDERPAALRVPERTGLSALTCLRVLRGQGGHSEGVRQRVMDTAQALGVRLVVDEKGVRRAYWP